MTEPASFIHAAPAFRLHCGINSLQQLGAELDRAGCRRAVIFCGQTMSRSPELNLVTDALGARHAGTFAGVKAHSPLPDVLAGTTALRDLQADAVIAVGGGSAVVSARASTIALAEGADIHALCTQFAPGRAPVSPKLLKPKLPQFVVTTTPNTSYAKAGTAVLDPVAKRRLTLFDPKTRASVVFFHPVLALTAPTPLVLDASLVSLASAIQGLESRTRDPMADAMLLHALRLHAQHLPHLAADQDGETRQQLMLAAFLAGLGTDYAPIGLGIALSHSMGARYGAPNGMTVAALLPHTLRFNEPVTGERLGLIAAGLGADADAIKSSAADAAIAAIRELLKTLNSPLRLRDAGIAREALQQIAEDTLGEWFLHTNPRKVADAATLLAVLEAAW